MGCLKSSLMIFDRHANLILISDKRIASLIQASGKDKSSKSLDIRGFEDFAFVDLVA